jgi:anti-sigma28 factor (negative regulator of flagellin synthesis)
MQQTRTLDERRLNNAQRQDEHDQYMSSLRLRRNTRARRVAEIKSQIAAGTYDSDERIDRAIEQLIQREFTEFYY